MSEVSENLPDAVSITGLLPQNLIAELSPLYADLRRPRISSKAMILSVFQDTVTHYSLDNILIAVYRNHGWVLKRPKVQHLCWLMVEEGVLLKVGSNFIRTSLRV